jgi:hypothetical protein
VTSAERIGGLPTDSWADDISRDIVEVWFSYLHGYWRIRLFSVFVNLKDKVVLIFL